MTTTLMSFRVHVVDGEMIPVPALEVGARFSYPGGLPTTWSSTLTDGDGYARFSDQHPAAPSSVCFYVEDEQCTTCEVEDGATLVLEM